ncbi:hypothetical protein QTP88_003425 [Uroleucon formosanum]
MKDTNSISNLTNNGTPENDEYEDDGEVALTALPLFCIGSFLIVVIFLSIAGNVLVCMAIYTDRGLRRIGNLFLASLAIADLFVGAYTTYLNRRNALLSIAGVWALAAFVSVVPICILSIHRPPKPVVFHAGDTEYMRCALDLTPEYAIISSCISFYIPCVVMIGIYCRLYRYAQKHVQSIRAVTRPLTTTTTTTTGTAAASSATLTAVHHHTSPYHVSDHKAAITVGVIMGTFLLCWVPFFCVNIIAAFCKTCIPEAAFKVLTWLGYSNSAFNPIIYSIFNTEFRDAFRRILTTHYPDWCFCKGYRTVVLSSDASFRHNQRRKPTGGGGCDFVSSASATAVVAASAVVKHNGKAAVPTASAQQSGCGVVGVPPIASPRSSVASLRPSRLNSSEKVIIEADEEI